MSELVDLGMLHPRLARLERPATSTSPGLSRSLAARFSIDPLLVRMTFILLVPVGGIGVVMYSWGVLLTCREGRDTPPITRLVPQFHSWTPRTQWLSVGISSVLAATAVSRIVPVSVIPILLLGLTVALVKRYRPLAPVEVEQGPQLPVVDLYAPEPETSAAPAPQQLAGPTPTSWLGALAIALLGGASFPALSLALGGPFPGAAAALGLVGVVTTGWALLIRSRRLPTVFLLFLLLGAGVFGTLATARVSPQHTASGERSSTEITHSYVADSATLDLRQLSPAESNTTVHIRATASDIRVLLAAPPADVEIFETVSDVEFVPTTEEASMPSPGPRLRIEATASSITVEHPQ